MVWKIIFAPQALEEIEQIVRFIAQDDLQAATRFDDYLVDANPNTFASRGTLVSTINSAFDER
jgi:plasmid stabilization system protein ParE